MKKVIFLTIYKKDNFEELEEFLEENNREGKNK
jgi:hypothetical protein